MELLIRNPDLPARAGKARIEFGSNFEARRDDDVIALPLSGGGHFFPIAKREQFIYQQDQERNYFGGTDEEPFLVRLNREPISHFRVHGEEAFFDALVPNLIKRVQRVLGIRYKRQGDIFAAPLPISWDGLRAMEALRLGKSIHEVEPKTMEFPVFETRHLFLGTAVQAKFFPESVGTSLFVEGRLRAPDHDDLMFREPHVLAQTAHLWDPQQAD